MAEVIGVLSLDNFRLVKSLNSSVETGFSSLDQKYSETYKELRKDDIKFSGISNENLAVISYTSGTTGFSKGVMITHNSLAANIRYAQNNMPLRSGDPVVSFLPLASPSKCFFGRGRGACAGRTGLRNRDRE